MPQYRWERNWRGGERTPDLNYNAGYEGLERERRAMERARGGGGGGRPQRPFRGEPEQRYDAGYRYSRVRFVPGGRQPSYDRGIERPFGGGSRTGPGYGRGPGRSYDRGW
jgi:hypothetical protein